MKRSGMLVRIHEVAGKSAFKPYYAASVFEVVALKDGRRVWQNSGNTTKTFNELDKALKAARRLAQEYNCRLVPGVGSLHGTPVVTLESYKVPEVGAEETKSLGGTAYRFLRMSKRRVKVDSENSDSHYKIRLTSAGPQCTCKGYAFRGTCKHCQAVTR